MESAATLTWTKHPRVYLAIGGIAQESIAAGRESWR